MFDRDEVLVRSRGADLGKMTFEDALQRFGSHLGPQGNVSSESAASHSPVRQNSASGALTAKFGNLNVHYAWSEKLAFNTKKRIEVLLNDLDWSYVDWREGLMRMIGGKLIICRADRVFSISYP